MTGGGFQRQRTLHSKGVQKSKRTSQKRRTAPQGTGAARISGRKAPRERTRLVPKKRLRHEKKESEREAEGQPGVLARVNESIPKKEKIG